MAERKFEVLEERPVGSLDDDLQQEWQRLVERKERLDKASANLELAFKKLFRKVESTHPVAPHEVEAYRGLRLTEEGQLMQVFCNCPACQAALHHMTVSSVVEEMHKSELISSEELGLMRKKAAELDAANRESSKKRALLN